MEVEQTQLAREIFGVTSRTIRDWEKAGMPSHGTGRRRKYHVPECVAWRIEEERRRVHEELAPRLQEREDTPKLDDSRARREAAVAALRELELAERRGELIPLDDHEHTLSEIAGVVHGLPRRTEFLRALARAMKVRPRDAVPAAETAVRLIVAAIRQLGEDDG